MALCIALEKQFMHSTQNNQRLAARGEHVKFGGVKLTL